MKVFKTLFAITLVTTIIASCLGEKKKNESALSNAPQEKLYAVFDDSNKLLRPKDYRSWVFMGTASTPKSVDPNAIFSDFQNIYVDPVSFAYWKKHGEWREGTIIVKERLHEGDTISPVGHGFFQSAHFSLSASVKDSKRFPAMHNGWNYFGFTDFKNFKLTENAIALGDKCAGCHHKNAIDGDVFYQYYPVMLAAKGYGDGNPENENTRPGLVEDFQHSKLIKEYIKNMKPQK